MFNLAFDFGGTLDSPFLHWMQVYLKVYNEQLHLNLAPDTFRDAYIFTEREMEGLHLVKPTDGLLQTQQYKTTLQIDYLCKQGVIRNHNHSELAQEAASLVTNFATAHLQANKPVLQALAKHYPLLLVSNYYGNLETVIAEAGMSPLFQSITDSTVVGIRKPDPAIWQNAFQRHGLKPGEVMVVGDSMKNDINPALSLGCQVVKCDPQDAEPVEGITCIHQLEELLAFLPVTK